MICALCGKKVFPEQHHIVLEEWKARKPSGRTYYHAQCFKEKFIIQQNMLGMLNKMGNFLNGMSKKIGIEEEKEVYKIESAP